MSIVFPQPTPPNMYSPWGAGGASALCPQLCHLSKRPEHHCLKLFHPTRLLASLLPHAVLLQRQHMSSGQLRGTGTDFPA